MSLTKEQIDEAIKSDEVKAAIAAAVDEAKKGLSAKNSELLGSVKELKEKIAAIEAEKEQAEETAAAKSGDVEKVKEQLAAKHAKEIEKLNGQIAKMNGQLETHVIGEGLTQALVKAKIAPHLMDAAKALIKQSYKGEIGDNDGKPFAKFDGKAVEEFVNAWSQSETGKHFVSADQNSGGGANGTNGKGNAKPAGNAKKTMTRAEFEALSGVEKVKASREGVSLVDA